jgi:hypothetical protein
MRVPPGGSSHGAGADSCLPGPSGVARDVPFAARCGVDGALRPRAGDRGGDSSILARAQFAAASIRRHSSLRCLATRGLGRRMVHPHRPAGV